MIRNVELDFVSEGKLVYQKTFCSTRCTYQRRTGCRIWWSAYIPYVSEYFWK